MPDPTYTTLEAINACLREIGQAGLVSYPSAFQGEDELTAVSCFNDAVRFVATLDDYPWNVQGDDRVFPGTLTVTANGAGKIILQPATTAYHVAQAVLHHEDLDFGTKIVDVRSDGGVRSLYNVTDSTFVWPANSTKKLQLSYSLDFNLLPSPAQEYVIAHAVWLMLKRKVQDPRLIADANFEKERVLGKLEAWNMKSEPGGYNMLDAPDAQDARTLFDDPFSLGYGIGY